MGIYCGTFIFNPTFRVGRVREIKMNIIMMIILFGLPPAQFSAVLTPQRVKTKSALERWREEWRKKNPLIGYAKTFQLPRRKYRT